jgi:hypothetical protein
MNYGMGFATYRGGAVQQRHAYVHGVDAATSAANSRGGGADALLKLPIPTTDNATIDLEIDLVSMQTGATSQVVINWANLHTTASIRVFLLILGGDDITDANVDQLTITTAGSTQDETVAAGFGQPDLIFFLGHGNTDGSALGNAMISFGWGKKGLDGRSIAFSQTDGNTASIVAAGQRADRCFQMIAVGGASYEAICKLSAPASWPTDGFQLTYDATPAFPDIMGYLALKGNFQVAEGANVAPITGGLPVVQDNNVGFAPKGAMLFGWNLVAQTTIRTTDADLVSIGVGAYDGTQEAWAGLGTMDSNSQQTTAKVNRNYGPSAALQSEADGVFTGNNFRLSWNDIDTVAREYHYLVLGNASGTIYTDSNTVRLALTPSSTEQADLVDSSTVTLTLTPSGTDTQSGPTQDAGTVALKLTPSSTEVFEPIDSGTVYLKLTPVTEVEGIYIFIDDFSSNDWSLWTTSTRGTGPNGLSVVNGRGKLSIAAGFPNEAGGIAAASTHTDADIVFSYQWENIVTSGTGSSFGAELQVWGRASGDWAAGGGADERWADDGYTHYVSNFSDSPGSGKNQVVVNLLNGAVTLVGFVDTNPPVDTNKRWVRFRFQGSAIKVRRWDDGSAEPSTWDAEFTDTLVGGPGVLQINLVSEATNPDPAVVYVDKIWVEKIATSVDYVDSNTVILKLTPFSTDVSDKVDLATVPLTLTPSGTEQREITDSNTVTLALTPNATETTQKQYTDAATVVLALTPSAAELREITDSGTVPLKLTPSATEQREITDSNTVLLKLTPSGVDTAQFVDAATVRLTLTPSGVDEYFGTQSDTGTVRLSLAPSPVEVFEAQDAVSVKLNLTPSTSESAVFVDSSTVPLRFTPSGSDSFTPLDIGTVYVTLTPSGQFSNTDAETVYLKLTPLTTLERLVFFDSLLTATVSRRWGGALQVRRWSGGATNRWFAMLVVRRWDATLGTRLWSGSAIRRWAGTLGRK